MAAAHPYLRSLVLVSLILSVSSASHVLAAGHLPAPGVMLLLGALLLVPMMLLTRATVSFRTGLLAMGAGQLLLHTLFGMTAVPAVCESSSANPGHHAAFELACSPGPEQMGEVAGGPLMVLLHAMATVILALAVTRSDQALALLGAWLRPLLRAPAGFAPTTPLRRSVFAGPAPVAPLPVHASVPSLRGPPGPEALPA